MTQTWKAGCLAVATPACVADDFGGEIVVLNLDSGLYFSLRGLAAALWRDLVSGHRPDGLIAAIAEADPAAGEAAAAFVGRLVELSLLRPSEAPASPAESLESLAVIRAGDRLPVLESYDDMKDLVLADPIHDTDEGFGWPVRRPDA